MVSRQVTDQMSMNKTKYSLGLDLLSSVDECDSELLPAEIANDSMDFDEPENLRTRSVSPNLLFTNPSDRYDSRFATNLFKVL